MHFRSNRCAETSTAQRRNETLECRNLISKRYIYVQRSQVHWNVALRLVLRFLVSTAANVGTQFNPSLFKGRLTITQLISMLLRNSLQVLVRHVQDLHFMGFPLCRCRSWQHCILPQSSVRHISTTQSTRPSDDQIHFHALMYMHKFGQNSVLFQTIKGRIRWSSWV